MMREWGRGMSPLEACSWAFNHASWWCQYDMFYRWWDLANAMAQIKLEARHVGR